MKSMAVFARDWVNKHASVPEVPVSLWTAITTGMAVTLYMSLAPVHHMKGTPWRIFRDLFARVAPGFAAMPLDVFQRKVFLVAICAPMLSLHAGDAVVAAYLARKRNHKLWLTYGFRTLILGFGQLRHLLPEGGAAYGAITAAVFCASALAAAKVR